MNAEKVFQLQADACFVIQASLSTRHQEVECLRRSLSASLLPSPWSSLSLSSSCNHRRRCRCWRASSRQGRKILTILSFLENRFWWIGSTVDLSRHWHDSATKKVRTWNILIKNALNQKVVLIEVIVGLEIPSSALSAYLLHLIFVIISYDFLNKKMFR